MTQIIFLSVFFVVLMVGMLWDLGVFSKSTHDEVTAKQALLHTLGWFSVGLLMTAFVYLFHGDLQSIAQVSDAGTPGISDPGFLLARACGEQGIDIEVLPGATAFVPALVKSGFALHQFRFEGFLPQKKGRQTRILALAANPDTTAFYESPHKILKTLEQLNEACLPGRRVSVSREISKKFEQTVTATIAEVLMHFKQHPPKGEFVVVLEGCNAKVGDDLLVDDEN